MRNFYPQWAGESLQTSPSITLTNTFPGEALPPGSQITTVGVDAAMEVARVDPNGTQTLLTNNNGLDAHVAISPDGRRIAFWSDRDGGADIYAMNTDGTNVVRVTNNGNSVDPSWTPDGNGLFYVSFQPSGSSLNLLDVASGKIKTVASFAYGIVVPELTSNGSQVIFLRPPESGQWWTGEMYIMPVEGGEPVLLTQSMSVINQTTFPWSTFLQAPDHYLNNH
jgi:TolB protein